MSFSEKLNSLVEKHKALGEKLSAGDLGGKEFAATSKEYSALSPIVEKVLEYQAALTSLADLELMAKDNSDKDMQAMAEEEMHEVKHRIPELENDIKILLLPKDEADEKNAMLEIRAGTGGDEAALFAGDLLTMYQRYAERMGWKFEVLEASEAEVGGFKEVVAMVTGRNVFQRLKYESGVHRVQRVPATETQGRVHTSAATVAVLPEAEEVDVEIKDEDLRIDTMRSSGAGGQHVNKTESAVRITHLPTGLVVTSSEKSQHQNRKIAMQVLRAQLYDLKRQEADSARSAARKGMVGSGDRSERIRTYNFPQSRVTDHRVNLTLYNLDMIVYAGDIDDIIDKLTAEDQAAKLAEAV